MTQSTPPSDDDVCPVRRRHFNEVATHKQPRFDLLRASVPIRSNNLDHWKRKDFGYGWVPTGITHTRAGIENPLPIYPWVSFVGITHLFLPKHHGYTHIPTPVGFNAILNHTWSALANPNLLERDTCIENKTLKSRRL